MPSPSGGPLLFTYLLTIRYHGSAYAGWQRQDGFDTVQERIEEALAILHGETQQVHGAGRTDAGVHALGQNAHVALAREWEPGELLRAINGNLPPDIAVSAVRPVAAGFHARFHARGKRYLYRMVVSRIRPIHGRDLCHWVRRPIDLAAMRRAVPHLLGRRDFAALATQPGYPLSRGTVRTIQHLHLVRRPRGVDLVIQGDGFLYNMVRTTAGTLLDVGLSKILPETIREILESGDRGRAGPNLPAQGLFLVRVLYPAGAFEGAIPLGPGPGKD